MLAISLPLSAAPWKAETQPVEDHLAALLAPEAQKGTIGDAMRYAVFGGAGRIRPILSVRTGSIMGSPLPLTVSAAAAVELLHCASLVVDDLPCMDNDSERRGRPSLHVRFGEAHAVLAAHSMVALAAKSIVHDTDCGAHFPAMLRFQAKLLDALDANGLCGGQQLDLAGAAPAERITELKTVPLFRLAVEAGMIGADPELLNKGRFALRSFAREIGILYQMTDDVLDGELWDPSELEAQYEVALASLSPLGADVAAPLVEIVEGLHGRIPAPLDCGHR